MVREYLPALHCITYVFFFFYIFIHNFCILLINLKIRTISTEQYIFENNNNVNVSLGYLSMHVSFNYGLLTLAMLTTLKQVLNANYDNS